MDDAHILSGQGLKKFKDKVSGVLKSVIQKYHKPIKITSCIALVAISGVVFYNTQVGFKVTFNGEELGYVKNKEIFVQAVNKVEEETIDQYGENIVFDKEYDFSQGLIDHDNLMDNLEQGMNRVYDTNTELLVKGATLVIDGEEILSLYSKDDAEEVIDQILEPYLRETTKSVVIDEPSIKENLDILESTIPYSDVIDTDEAVNLLTQGSEEVKEYVVKDGDTSWDIAVNRGENVVETLEEIEKANPDVNLERLRGGDVIKLNEVEPYLTVVTTRQETKEENVQYETEYKDDSSLYIGKSKVITEGRDGLKQLTYTVEFENGVEVSRELGKEEIIKQPTNEVVAKGTKEHPPGVGTGRFIMPASGRVSAINKAGSHSGSRAVDVANSVGTPIYAADTGRVVKSSDTGNGYGGCIIIDHGNGYRTLYAHLSSYNVSVGQNVSKGQKIGGMGSTGNSTGSHLHFEVIKNGARQPIKNYYSNLRVGIHVSANR